MRKITKIKEKVELKDLEVQSNNPCKGPGEIDCRYNCCSDCHDGTSSWQSPLY